MGFASQRDLLYRIAAALSRGGFGEGIGDNWLAGLHSGGQMAIIEAVAWAAAVHGCGLGRGEWYPEGLWAAGK